jgi:hypothetical protein
MKPTLLLSCVLALGVAAPIASASPTADIPFFHRHKKDPAATTATTTPKPKSKLNLLHRAHPTRDDAARSEAAYGMPGPQSVGYFHPQPGPAGVGAK